MHIPVCETGSLHIQPFAEALRGGGAADYDRARWLFVPDRYDEYRYILGTLGHRPLICLGVNPSTAAPDDLDNTLKSVARIASANGYDSWMMMNVYAQRATRPDDLDRCRNETLHRENLLAFDWLLERAGAAPAVWAAWGTVIEKRPWLADCVRDLYAHGLAHGARWYSCGARSKAGHPHHPLYLRRDAPLEDFDAAAYLATLQG